MHRSLHDLISQITCDADTDLAALFNKGTPDQKKALIDALQMAYQSGQVDADRKTGRFVSMVVGPLLGIEPTLDGVAIGMGAKSISTIRSAMGRLVDRRSSG